MPLSGGGKLSHLWAGLFWVPPKPQRVHHAEPETQEEDCEDTEEQHSPGNGAGCRPVFTCLLYLGNNLNQEWMSS